MNEISSALARSTRGIHLSNGEYIVATVNWNALAFDDNRVGL